MQSKSVPASAQVRDTLNDEISSVWRDVRPKLISALSARYKDMELAEDALSEAMIAAQTGWTAGLPQNPSGWLYRVACRKAVDLIRKRDGQRKLLEQCKTETGTDSMNSLPETDQPPEHRLGFFFACAHPSVSVDAQIALILFHLGGLSTTQIGSAILSPTQNVQQRLKRARDKLKINAVGYDIPQPSDWPDRLPPVLSAIEIIYDRSYSNLSGGTEIDALAREALILAELLARLMPDEPEVQSLCALLFSLEARRPARMWNDRFISFEDQNPTLWSKPHLRLATRYLERAQKVVGVGHLPAGRYAVRAHIANLQISEKLTGKDQSPAILAAYDDLLRLSPSPVTAISRALILKKIDGAMAALEALEQIDFGKFKTSYAPWLLAKADCLTELGRHLQAESLLETAIPLIEGDAERQYVMRKCASLK